MARAPQATDFNVEVEGVGTFVFGRRSTSDVYKIRGRYNALTEGNYGEDGRMNDVGALAFVTLQTLLVSSPESFDMASLDPLMDDDFDEKVVKVFAALRAKELSFRSGEKAAG
ncbi:hypothetical protein [Burkholderia anthina]|uniref:hypothetical protein n=1 Tax=Burkholderia anthina TaxID=179879 RepID=UPI00158D5660|nr:hypothetical protein [Burkholderia anthina]